MPTGLGDEQLWLCPTLDNATPFNDLSTQGNNGTAQGGLSTITDTGAGGAYAYNLDGIDDFILLPAGVIPTTGSLTISLWVEHTNTTGSKAYVSDWDSAATKRSVLFTSISGNHSAYFSNNGTAVVNQISGSAVTTTWTHVLLSQKAGTGELELYRNGVLDDTGGPYLGRYNSGTPWLVGALGATGSYQWFFDGKMDDIRAYNRLLTQSEITHLATARGIEGRPFDGLGDEQLWLCPSLENSPNDISGNNNNGVYQGGMGTIADTAEGGSLAYDFDGTDDYIDCGNVLNITGPLSISFWVLNDTASKAMYVSKTWDGSTEGYISRLDSWTGILRYYTYDATFYGTFIANPFTLSQWSCVTNVYNGTHWEIYIDGAMVAQTADTQAPFSNTGNLQFGNTTAAGGWNLDGRMDDIRIYNRALTQAEITHLASQRGVLGTPPEGLGDEQLWLCPSIDDSPDDLSGNGNNGVYGGGMGTVSDTAEGGSLAYNNNSTNQFVKVSGTIGTTFVSTAMWVKRTALDNATTWFCGTNAYSSPSWSDALYTYSSSDYVRAGDAETGISPALPLGGVWFHLCTVSNGGTTDIYVDGLLHDSVSTASPSATTEEFYLGSSASSTVTSSKYYDDIRVYDRVLTQAEISWLATERGVLGTPPEGLGDEQLWLCPSIQDGANDLSGNGNDGVIGSSITTVADTSNGGTLAYNFPDTAGTNTITINDFDLGGLSQLTWSAWIYDESDNAASTHSSFFSWRRTGGGGNDDILFFNYERSWLGFQVNNGADGQASYTPVYYQNWKHYCVVFDGTNPTATDRLNLYVNGVLQTPDTTFSYPATTASPSGTPYAEIGDYVGSGNHELFNFKGKQDDIRIYDRAITQDEITHLASQRGVLGPASGGPPASVFFNPFSSKTFHPFNNKRIR